MIYLVKNDFLDFSLTLCHYTPLTSDEPELEFSSSSRAMKVPSRAELGHFNFRAETELDFF